ncbi:uncharacterized protein RHIMIDRAFT_269065 [Rhizopus microsporus ATCC 52813]|uniref:Uncharacterized protein n=1 Tax=Rhizopus microsporus ATCC 52813 TaxID=1340429 RepID=A0A2G4SHW4_RHIZD|nr:uncharacterized protein RHIMIDRAFT_269065 [Rhizopus microsporus ATCC 52813]PHZ08342.1 hypothetical protein RHIMIDRAFT_269065 [Rhizopus microsporus ATCC 52813]
MGSLSIQDFAIRMKWLCAIISSGSNSWVFWVIYRKWKTQAVVYDRYMRRAKVYLQRASQDARE